MCTFVFLAPEPDDAAVAPVHVRDSVTLQCSGSDSDRCAVCCFTCTEGNTLSNYDKDPDGHACVFNNISSSDDGSYYCAVATCEEADSGNGSEDNNEGKDCYTTKDLTCFLASLRLICMT